MSDPAETGESYDVDIAASHYDSAVDALASFGASLPVSRVLYIVGNDLLHADNAAGTTTAGTPQDMAGRWHRAYHAAFRSVVRGVEVLRPLGPVDMVIQPGNHDRDSTWLMGEALKAWFRTDDGVRVLNEPSPRRYYAVDKVLLGITHGNGEKLRDLPGIMADETGARWANARRKEWLIGHYHRRSTMSSMPMADDRGVTIRTLPSLTAADAWHTRRGYHGQRAAAAIAYSLDGLRVHDYTVALAEDERRERGVFVADGDADGTR